MAKDKAKGKTKEIFPGAIGYSDKPIAGISLYHVYDPSKHEPSVEEILEDIERDEARSAKKELAFAKLRGRLEGKPKEASNTKRYIVDPNTGRIDVDEKEGEYSYKDALAVSSSTIQSRAGQGGQATGGPFEAAMNLINAIKTLTPAGEAKPERPKEWGVDPDTGVIYRDEEEGEYTLGQARVVSLSVQKSLPPAEDGKKLFYIDEEGRRIIVEPGTVITQNKPPSVKTILLKPDGTEMEIDESKRVIVLNQPASEGSGLFPFPITDDEGKPLTLAKVPLSEWVNLKAEASKERRAEEKHKGVLDVLQTLKKYIPLGAKAIERAMQGRDGGVASEKLSVICGECGRKNLVKEGLKTFKCKECSTSNSL
jgi:hypothetical protein